MPRNKTFKVVAGVAVSFIGLTGAIILLLMTEIVSVEVAKLMLVALIAIYVGVGFLIAVYRLIGRLE
jgi:hypothetical protein